VKKGKKIKVIGEFGMAEEKFGYAVRKEDTALLAKLNDGLKKLMASPKWQELKTKYEIK
jgi:polar amino acid transport system substrate-binding protein